jgi:ribonuclease P protein component
MRREYRLRRTADFERVRANRSSWAQPLLVCSRIARGDSEPTRVGIVVGRRVGKATVRNRVKRRIREAARMLHPRLQPGNDVVFIARPAAAAASLADLAKAVESLVGRARLWRAEEAGRDQRSGSASDMP